MQKLLLACALLAVNVSAFAPASHPTVRAAALKGGKENELRTRIASVSNTQKITTAMRLVAAAKVRRAQAAVLAGRPFSEALQTVFGKLVDEVSKEDIEELPLLKQREVSKVTLVVLAGDRGLCGGFNTYAIKKAQARLDELEAKNIDAELVIVGKKPASWFKRRPTPIADTYQMGQAPNSAESNAITTFVMNRYLAGETDSVEFVYTKFLSLIASAPQIRTVLPLKLRGIEMEGDEIFMLTTKQGKLAVERAESAPTGQAEQKGYMSYEQDPLIIFNAVLPLYLNGQILRMLQESVASELAARMTAMAAASDNAKSLKRDLNRVYNRARQASVTNEILEIVSGADAANA